MNAYPLKPGTQVKDTLDALIADHGLRPVLLTLLSRLTKRTRPPDTGVGLKATDVPKLDLLNDHLRADLGLPPAPSKRAYVDLHALWHRPY